MSMRKVKKVCRGATFFLFLLLMSVSLTGCAFLAALGPILSVLGSLAGVAGSIVGIFNPQVGNAISQAGGALTQAGDQTTAIAQQFTPTTTAATTPTTTAPTAVGAPTNSEDGIVIGKSEATEAQRQTALANAQKYMQSQGLSTQAPAAKSANVSVQAPTQNSSKATTSAPPAANTPNSFSSINTVPPKSMDVINNPSPFSSINNLPAANAANSADFTQKPFTLSNMEEAARPLLPETVFKKIDWKAALTVDKAGK